MAKTGVPLIAPPPPIVTRAFTAVLYRPICADRVALRPTAIVLIGALLVGSARKCAERSGAVLRTGPGETRLTPQKLGHPAFAPHMLAGSPSNERAGIRLGEKLKQNMIAVGVGPDLRMAVVGSPAYLALHPAPSAPQDLMHHACVNYRMMASGEILDWEFERNGRTLAIKVTGPLTFNDLGPILEAALDGLGIA